MYPLPWQYDPRMLAATPDNIKPWRALNWLAVTLILVGYALMLVVAGNAGLNKTERCSQQPAACETQR